jgi:ATP-dependent DNA helicase Q1
MDYPSPDYKKLNILRKLLPRVPILALSATCPPRVLQDLLKILGLKEITDGNSTYASHGNLYKHSSFLGAQISGTVYFSAPLYRKNLHYTVIPKPSSSASMIKTMCDYILSKHRGHSGIIYCLSKAVGTTEWIPSPRLLLMKPY